MLNDLFDEIICTETGIRKSMSAQKLKNMFQHNNIIIIKKPNKALEYALSYGRGISKENGRKFVRMYVNADTVNMGKEGEAALKRLFSLAFDKGIIDSIPELDFIRV